MTEVGRVPLVSDKCGCRAGALRTCQERRQEHRDPALKDFCKEDSLSPSVLSRKSEMAPHEPIFASPRLAV